MKKKKKNKDKLQNEENSPKRKLDELELQNDTASEKKKKKKEEKHHKSKEDTDGDETVSDEQVVVTGKNARDAKYAAVKTFLDLGLPKNVLECCKGFEKPSPIQSRAWPFLLDGRDLIGIAATGSGKTLAFGLPTVMHVLRKRKSKASSKGRNPLCLVLSPTRELAHGHEIWGKKNNLLISSGETFNRCGDFCVPEMYLSKGCRCQVVLCFLFCSYFLLVTAQNIDPVEVDALRAIKERLNDINGNLSKWGSGDPCTSNWTGVVCSDTTLNDGYLHVLQLQLLNMNLSGTLAPGIGNLSHLEILSFMWNNISGNILKEIGNIKTLKLLFSCGCLGLCYIKVLR